MTAKCYHNNILPYRFSESLGTGEKAVFKFPPLKMFFEFPMY